MFIFSALASPVLCKHHRKLDFWLHTWKWSQEGAAQAFLEECLSLWVLELFADCLPIIGAFSSVCGRLTAMFLPYPEAQRWSYLGCRKWCWKWCWELCFCQSLQRLGDIVQKRNLKRDVTNDVGTLCKRHNAFNGQFFAQVSFLGLAGIHGYPWQERSGRLPCDFCRIPFVRRHADGLLPAQIRCN